MSVKDKIREIISPALWSPHHVERVLDELCALISPAADPRAEAWEKLRAFLAQLVSACDGPHYQQFRAAYEAVAREMDRQKDAFAAPQEAGTTRTMHEYIEGGYFCQGCKDISYTQPCVECTVRQLKPAQSPQEAGVEEMLRRSTEDIKAGRIHSHAEVIAEFQEAGKAESDPIREGIESSVRHSELAAAIKEFEKWISVQHFKLHPRAVAQRFEQVTALIASESSP